MSTGTPYGVPPFNEVVSATVIPVAPDTSDGDAEHLVERAREHPAVHAPG